MKYRNVLEFCEIMFKYRRYIIYNHKIEYAILKKDMHFIQKTLILICKGVTISKFTN